MHLLTHSDVEQLARRFLQKNSDTEDNSLSNNKTCSATATMDLIRYLQLLTAGILTDMHAHTHTQSLFMVALWNRADPLYFCPAVTSFFLLSFFSSPNLSRRRLDVCHTSTPGVALIRISDAGLKPAVCGSLKTQDAKKSPKIAIWAPSHNYVGLYLRN